VTSGGKPAHVPPLDGLRGIAVLLVMLHHFWLVPTVARTDVSAGTLPLLADRALMAVAVSGWVGVDLFFVLSGFLITGILLDTKGSRSYFRTFYIRRTLRIFPLYYCFVAVVLVLPVVVGIGVPGVREMVHDTAAWYLTYTSNILIAWRGWESVPLALGHLWSLAIEEQFYLVWPLVVFALSPRSLGRICFGIILASLGLRIIFVSMGFSPEAAYVFTLTRADTLAVGALVALSVRQPGEAPSQRWWGLIGVASAAALLLVFVRDRGLSYEDRFVGTIGYTAIALLFAAVVLNAYSCSPGTWRGRLLGAATLRWLGRRSYAVYIFHVPVIYAIVGVGVHPHSFPTLFGTPLPGRVVIFVVATGISLAMAAISWIILERPFLRLKDRFGYVFAEPGDASGAVPASQPVSQRGI
jgi:peptidoglycan/LPS O-acetylase OafA/YrhL